LLASCSRQESLQEYYVNSQDRDGFITTSIPKSIVGINEENLTEESQAAYRSIDKVNILALPINDDTRERFEQESARLDRIFENEDYKMLMSHKPNDTDGLRVKMVYDGSQEAIDEIIVYGRSPKMGLGVARVLGDDMNVGAIMNMLQELEKDKSNVGNIEGILGGMGIPTTGINIDPIE
jgi:hypothetical protein